MVTIATYERTDRGRAGRERDRRLPRGARSGGPLVGGGHDGYGFPVPYSYDGKAVYFRLSSAPESQKRSFVDAAERASLVVYDETGAGWRSVVVEGRISGPPPGQLGSSLVEAVRGFHIPCFAVFREPSSELEFQLYRLSPDSLTGVVEGK